MKVVLANIWMMLLHKSDTHIPQEILALICAFFFKDYCSPLFLFSLIGVGMILAIANHLTFDFIVPEYTVKPYSMV